MTNDVRTFETGFERQEGLRPSRIDVIQAEPMRRRGSAEAKHVVPGGLPTEALVADVLVRKYALLTGDDLGAENWATFASLIETCKLDGINPQDYPTDLLARIVLRVDTVPVDDLLSYNWVNSHSAASAVIDQAA